MKAVCLKVEDVLAAYKDAVYEQDLDRFLSIYAPDIHLYDSWDEWESKGHSQLRDMAAAWFNGLKEDGVVLQISYQDIMLEEQKDLAFVHCAVTYAAHQAESGEKIREMTNRFTFCLRKVNGSWLISHEHSSLPIDTETGMGLSPSR